VTPARLVVDADPRLAAALRDLAHAARLVFFAGLPGTGKSMLAHQLTQIATESGRRVHLLQWDVSRPPFEASLAGRRYPVVGGVTQPMIRKAVGLWARRALADWHAAHPDARELLVGETPFVGNRLVELARPADDDAEPLLAAPSCRFVVAVPSRAVRRHLEAERERRAARPLHPREREDAPPHVLRALWSEVAEVAAKLGVGETGADYDPDAYRRVYELVLRHRHVEALAIDTVLPTESMSVYDFAVAPPDLAPSETDAERFIAEAERRHPDAAALAEETARWWGA
jgi:hypothetical protein